MSSKKKTAATKDDGKPTLVPKLRFPEFRGTDEWQEIPIGEKVDLLSGYPFDGPDITQDSSGIRLLRGINITEGRIRHSPEIDRYYRGAVEGLEKFRVRVNDLVIGMDGSKVGKNSALVTKEDEDALLIQRVARLRASGSTLIQFIFQQINSTTFHTYVDKINTSSGIPHISAQQIKNFAIAFPSNAEQQKIASCLSSVDELTAAQGWKVDALKTHKKGLMQQLFPRKGETQPRLRFPEFKNAAEWESKPFEEFVTKSFYGTSSSTSPKGKYPVLRMGNMVDGGLDFTNLVYLDLDADSFESFRLEDGDILLNRTNSLALVGKISLFQLKSDCITASYIVTYRLNKERMVPAFCNAMLNTPLYQSRIKSFAKPSVSQANINPTTFKKELIVTVPFVPEQQRIASCLSSLDALITAETQKLEGLKTHKRGLMQQLFPSPAKTA